MRTKINMHRTKNLKVSLCGILVTGIFLTGSFVTHSEYTKKIDAVQDELSIVQNELVERKKMLVNTQNELRQTQADYQFEFERATQLSESIDDIESKLKSANTTINDLKNSEYQLVYMGDFKLTHYCPGYHGEPCGTGDGITATGTKVTAGRTIAVDPQKIPYGTTVYVEGYGFLVAEDCGGSVKGNHIDIAVSDHATALSMGTKTGGVWILVKNS